MPEATGQPKVEKQPERAGGFGNLGGLRVSLMPAETEGRRPPDLGRSLVVLAIVLLVETLVIGGVYFFLAQASTGQAKAQADLRQRIQGLDAQIQKEEGAAREMTAFSAQVAATAEALSGHVYWRKFFELLEENTTPTVRYVNFTGDASSGSAILDAVAISYRDMAEQIVLLRENPLIASVRATSASARVNEVGEVNGVAFTMTVKFDPKLMRYSEEK